MKKLILNHPYHLVTFSPWPILLSFNIFMLMVSLINWFVNYKVEFLYLSSFMMVMVLFQWWRDVIRESFYQGFHTKSVISGLKLGMGLFIVSEIFVFFSIFWCYFHMFLSPSVEIGALWPPKNIKFFNPYSIPLLNTIVLLTSGVFVTWCHYLLMNSDKFMSMLILFLTIILGAIFSFFQIYEYDESYFTFSDSVFGSIFFLSTGFHGFHVFVGTMFLLVNLVRIVKDNFSSYHFFGFEAAAWYWHFVDVVWLMLYMLVYMFNS